MVLRSFEHFSGVFLLSIPQMLLVSALGFPEEFHKLIKLGASTAILAVEMESVEVIGAVHFPNSSVRKRPCVGLLQASNSAHKLFMHFLENCGFQCFYDSRGYENHPILQQQFLEALMHSNPAHHRSCANPPTMFTPCRPL